MPRAKVSIRALREELAAMTRERDAYMRAKQENDERFMIERDTARMERDEAVAESARVMQDRESLLFDLNYASAKLTDALAVVREFVSADAACAAGNDVEGETERCVRWSRAKGALVALASELTP